MAIDIRSSQPVSSEASQNLMPEAQDVYDIEGQPSFPLPKQSAQHGYGGPSVESPQHITTQLRCKMTCTPYPATPYPSSPPYSVCFSTSSTPVCKRLWRVSVQLPPRPTISRSRTPRALIRGGGFTALEVVSLLDVLQRAQPIGGEEWEVVTQEHNKQFPESNRTMDSICRNFATLHRKKNQLGIRAYLQTCAVQSIFAT